MLSEAELQELRGMAFDRLLLQLWPKDDNSTLRTLRCRSCSAKITGRMGSRRLCINCYSKWRYHSRIPGNEAIAAAMNPGPPRASGFKEYEDVLMAKRIGVCRDTLSAWRNGAVPGLGTIRRVAPQLEAEFGVPETLWLEALTVSNLMRGRQLSMYGKEFSRIPQSAPATPTPRQDPSGLRYGYWVVLSVAGYRPGHFPIICVRARCLVCGSVHEVQINTLREGTSGMCRPCSSRLQNWSRPSGFRGVTISRSCGPGECWRVQRKSTGAPSRHFRDPVTAARYYDACMYERYGHTLFLNFPDEYDRSNDPVFVPVGASR